jgi:uncharacterized protein (DUF885 family)
LDTIDSKNLSEEKKTVTKIIKWEVAVGKEFTTYDLMPVHQFWGVHTYQWDNLQEEAAPKPFNTEKDYTNFSKEWTRIAYGFDSAMVYMEKRIAKGASLTQNH